VSAHSTRVLAYVTAVCHMSTCVSGARYCVNSSHCSRIQYLS